MASVARRAHLSFELEPVTNEKVSVFANLLGYFAYFFSFSGSKNIRLL